MATYVLDPWTKRPTDDGHDLRRWAIYAVFFLSGIAGLGYQIAWTRMFSSGLGHEFPSMLAVVAAFFGGLAVGSWALDGPVSRSPRPGLWYVALEVVIGVWALLSAGLIYHINDAALGLIGLEPSTARHWLVAFLVPLVALLPATAAMGGTLPAIERHVAPLTRDGRCVGRLYGLNTAGAMAGVLASAFVLLPALGFRHTILVLAGVNFLCAVAVWALGKSNTKAPSKANPSNTAPQASSPRQPDFPMWRLGAIAFATGLLGIGYEVLGVRVMAQLLENTVYSFAAVLAVYLLGTALGATIYQRSLARLPFLPVLGYLLCGISAACMLGITALSNAQPLYAYARRDLFGDSLWGVMAAEMTVAATVFFLPTLFMGATFSHLVQAAKRSEGGVGWAAAVNTIGASLAALLFGVLLLPVLGAKWALVLVSLSYLVLIPLRSKVPWALEAVPLLLVLVLPVHFQIINKSNDQTVVEYREGVLSTVAVVQSANGHKELRVNNRFRMGSTDGAAFECLQASIPLLLHPQPQRALFLGLGTAITFRASAFEPGLTADGVELLPQVVQVMPHFLINNLPAGYEARQKVYVADARRFVRSPGKPYDVIVADLFQPGSDGAGSLYTRQHFQAIRDRLAPDGLFCQWLPLYQLDQDMLKVIIRTFLEVFPNTHAYLADFNILHPALGLVATIEPTNYPPDWFDNRVTDTVLRRYLAGIAVDGDVRLFGSCIADARQLRDYAGDAPINTDDWPIVTFEAPRFTNLQDSLSYGRLVALIDQFHFNPADVLTTKPNSGQPPKEHPLSDRLVRYTQARDDYIHGLVALAEGRRRHALELLLKSAQRSEDFIQAYAQCLALAVEISRTNPQAARDLLRQLAQAQPDRNEAATLLARLNKG